jgi:hypothetical protein
MEKPVLAWWRRWRESKLTVGVDVVGVDVADGGGGPRMGSWASNLSWNLDARLWLWAVVAGMGLGDTYTV